MRGSALQAPHTQTTHQLTHCPCLPPGFQNVDLNKQPCSTGDGDASAFHVSSRGMEALAHPDSMRSTATSSSIAAKAVDWLIGLSGRGFDIDLKIDMACTSAHTAPIICDIKGGVHEQRWRGEAKRGPAGHVHRCCLASPTFATPYTCSTTCINTR